MCNGQSEENLGESPCFCGEHHCKVIYSAVIMSVQQFFIQLCCYSLATSLPRYKIKYEQYFNIENSYYWVGSVDFAAPPAPGIPLLTFWELPSSAVQTDKALQLHLKLQIHLEGVNSRAPVAAAGRNLCWKYLNIQKKEVQTAEHLVLPLLAWL